MAMVEATAATANERAGEHPLLGYFPAAAEGYFPAIDGAVAVLPAPPGNARSLRAFLAAGFIPIGADVLLRPARAGKAPA